MIARCLLTLRRYRAIVWFFAALIGLDAVVAANARRWESYDLNPYRERLARCREQAWDVLVVGGSPAMCGVDPALLVGATWQGRALESCYNLGLPLATASEVCLAVEHAVAAPPRLMIYAVSATDLNDARLEPQGPRAMMSALDAVRWAMLRPRDGEWCLRHYLSECVGSAWQLYRQRNGIRLWAADVAERLCPGWCPELASTARINAQIIGELRNGSGYRQAPIEAPQVRLDLWKAAGMPCDRLPFLEPYRVGGGHVTYLRRLLESAEKQRVPVLLVDLPVPPDLDERLYPREYGRYRAALAETAARFKVPLIAASRDVVGLTDADYSDLIHLNAAGAARLSAWLRDRIDERGRLAAAEGAPR